MAVVAVLVFVAAYILIATERVPKSRALLLADLSGRGFCSGSKTREGGPMDGKCKPEAAHSSHLWRCAHECASTEVYAKSDRAARVFVGPDRFPGEVFGQEQRAGLIRHGRGGLIMQPADRWPRPA